MKVLIVDDDPDIRLVASVSLKNIGLYEVYTANDGIEAIREAKQIHPDVILLDFIMPEMNGDIVLKKLLADHELKNIPIIFLTAKSDANHKSRLLDLGAKGIINKPFDPLDFASQIEKILNS